MKRAFLLTFLFITSGAHAAIFGVDDRVAITESSPYYQLARATAVAVLSSLHSQSGPGKIKLDTESTSEFLCAEEKFSNEPSLSYACSGFLVAPDLIATAGHCAVNVGESRNETEIYCPTFSWLFDYRDSDSGKMRPDDVLQKNFYRCKQVVYAVREEQSPYRDFALIQLDRPVLDRAPLKLSHAPVLGTESVMMIGYPHGTPAKLSMPARVLLSDLGRLEFIASLDAFEGNSGSAVFNRNGEVVGILEGSTPSQSLVEDRARGCSRYNRCAEDGTSCIDMDADASIFPGFQRVGAEVQRLDGLIEAIRAFEHTRQIAR